MPRPRYISPAELIEKAETLAPVSGARCRDCGISPQRTHPLLAWLIENYTAYCRECWTEREGPMPAVTATNCDASVGA